MPQELEDQKRRIMDELDLEPIMVKAMDKDEGYGWSLDFTKSVAQEYRRYLSLTLKHPDIPVVPSTYVDDFWHLHILDTLKYVEDCDNYLGGFLHHFPYFGMRGEEDARNLHNAWLNTRKLYENAFGSIPESIWPLSTRCPNCGVRCRTNRTPFRNEVRPRLADIQA